jgi:hypothetical protein
MRKLLIAGCLAAGTAFVLSPQAFSQRTGGSTGADPAPSTHLPSPEPGFAQGPREAPIGHRQPTAQDVPQNEKSTIEAVDQMDKELDRKLDICRGC